MKKIVLGMDTSFIHQQSLGSAMNWHAKSFQSTGIESASGMALLGDYYAINSNESTAYSGNSSIVSNNLGVSQVRSSCGPLLVDSVPGLKHDAELEVEWSFEEQYKLEEGLAKYSHEPSISRYIKIAATLHDKTVRDVALRCRWMVRKRRKYESLNFEEVNGKKDKLEELSSKSSLDSASPLNIPGTSHVMNHCVEADGIPLEALSCTIRHLLEQNVEVLGRISANIASLKLQENIDLFHQMKNNLTLIINELRYLPGLPLPVSVNEELANSILPHTNRKIMFGSSSGTFMKQEPGY